MTIRFIASKDGYAVGTRVSLSATQEAAYIAGGYAVASAQILETVDPSNAGALAASISAYVAPYIGQVATNCRQPIYFNTTYKQMMNRSHHVAQVDLTQIQLVFPNWHSSETATGAASTITASIEYPSGTFTQVKFGGATQGTIASGANLISDPAYVLIPSGAAFWVRSYVTNTAGIPFGGYTNSASEGLGQAFSFAVSGLVDQTMGGTITNTPSNVYTPIAIIGLTNKPSVLVLGDSRAAGQGDAGSANTPESGQITRSLYPSIAYINASRPGERAVDYLAANTLRSALSVYCTHVICEMGVNDLASRTAAQVLADLQSMRATVNGRKFYQATILPQSTSTDSFATVANQTTAASNAQRVALNASIRAVPAGFAGYLETADPVESSRDSGLWKAPGYTTDGIHGTASGYALIQNAAAIVPASLTRY